MIRFETHIISGIWCSDMLRGRLRMYQFLVPQAYSRILFIPPVSCPLTCSLPGNLCGSIRILGVKSTGKSTDSCRYSLCHSTHTGPVVFSRSIALLAGSPRSAFVDDFRRESTPCKRPYNVCPQSFRISAPLACCSGLDLAPLRE